MRKKPDLQIDTHLSRGVETELLVPFDGDKLDFILVVPDGAVTIKVNDKTNPDKVFSLRACQTIGWSELEAKDLAPNPFAGMTSQRWFVTCTEAKFPKHRFRVRVHVKDEGVSDGGQSSEGDSVSSSRRNVDVQHGGPAREHGRPKQDRRQTQD